MASCVLEMASAGYNALRWIVFVLNFIFWVCFSYEYISYLLTFLAEV